MVTNNGWNFIDFGELNTYFWIEIFGQKLNSNVFGQKFFIDFGGIKIIANSKNYIISNLRIGIYIQNNDGAR